MSAAPLTGSSPSSRRVLTVGPMPPEKLAYALARYSRSPDSIRDSAWYSIVDDDWPRVRAMLEGKIAKHAG